MTALETLDLWFQKEKLENGLVDVKFVMGSKFDNQDLTEDEIAVLLEEFAVEMLRIEGVPYTPGEGTR